MKVTNIDLKQLLMGAGLIALLAIPRVTRAEEPALRLTGALIGAKLETSSFVTLSDSAPEGGLTITIRSSDSSRLLVSAASDSRGESEISLRISAGGQRSPEFWLQALTGEDDAEITAEAQGYRPAEAKIKLTPSSVAMVGPGGGSSFTTTTLSDPTFVQLVAVRLDDSLDIAEEQLVAGGISLALQVKSTNADVGHVADAVMIPAGTSAARAKFEPAGEGQITLSLDLPNGLTTGKQGTVSVLVRRPGIAVSDHLVIGKDLEVGGVLSLGAPAPDGGVSVRLASSNEKRILLSDAREKEGSGELTIHVPAGEATANYFIQSLGDSGEVTYTASASGFSERTATVGMSPSGIVLTPEFHGPPDEANVMRREGIEGRHEFATNLNPPNPTRLIAWTAQLDPKTLRAADITVQPLRAGVHITVGIESSNPAVGQANDNITIGGGSESGKFDFTPLSSGSTQLSVLTPAGFTTPANATVVLAVVGP